MYLSQSRDYKIQVNNRYFLTKEVRLALLELGEMLEEINEEQRKEDRVSLILGLLKTIKNTYHKPVVRKYCYHSHLKTEGEIRATKCDKCNEKIYQYNLFI